MIRPLIVEHEVFRGRGGSAATIKKVADDFYTGGVCDGLTPVGGGSAPAELVTAWNFIRAIRQSKRELLWRVAEKANDDIGLFHEEMLEIKRDESASNLYGLSAVLFRITPAWVTLMCWGDVRCFAQLRDGGFWASPDLQSEHEAKMYRLINACFERASAELGIPRDVHHPGQRELLQKEMWRHFTPLLRKARDDRINTDDPLGYPVLSGHPEAVKRARVIKFSTAKVKVVAVLDDGLYEYCGREEFADLPDKIQVENNLKFIEERGLRGQAAFLDAQDAAAAEVTHVRGRKDRAGIYFRLG